MVIWIIGLSGAGKTTLGRTLQEQWRAQGGQPVLVDGDEIRRLFGHDSADAYTPAGRRRNAERLVALCQWLDRQQIDVICCVLALFPDLLAGNRERFRRYFEIFLDAPLAALEARDPKGLYAAARDRRTANVVGVDIPFPRPVAPDLVIDAGGPLPDVAALARSLLARIRS